MAFWHATGYGVHVKVWVSLEHLHPPTQGNLGVACCALTHSNHKPSPNHCISYCDNANVVDCFRLAKCPEFNLFHKHPSGLWIKSYRSSVAILLTQGIRVEVRWIKAHTGFKGNEIAGAFAKWASYAISPTSLYPPPPQGKHRHLGLSTAWQNFTKIVFTNPAQTCTHRHQGA